MCVNLCSLWIAHEIRNTKYEVIQEMHKTLIIMDAEWGPNAKRVHCTLTECVEYWIKCEQSGIWSLFGVCVCVCGLNSLSFYLNVRYKLVNAYLNKLWIVNRMTMKTGYNISTISTSIQDIKLIWMQTINTVRYSIVYKLEKHLVAYAISTSSTGSTCRVVASVPAPDHKKMV